MEQAHPAAMAAQKITKNANSKTWPSIFTAKNVNLFAQTTIFMIPRHIVGAMVFAVELGTTHPRVHIKKKDTSTMLHAKTHKMDVKLILTGIDSSAATQSTIKLIKKNLTLLTTCLH